MAQSFLSFEIMKKYRLYSWLNIISLLIHVAVAYASNTKMINGNSMGEVSAKYDSLFAPAGFTFSIWSVLYISLLAFAIYHLVCSYRSTEDHPANFDTNRIGSWFILNNLAAVAWLYTWTAEMIVLSLVLMAIQLLCLLFINLRLKIYEPRRELASKFFTQFPFGLYMGWIVVATIANLAAWLGTTSWEWWKQSEVVGTQFLIGLAGILAVFMMVRRRNAFFGMAVVWAFYGIAQKRRQENVDDHAILVQTAWMGIAIVGFILVVQLITNASRRKERIKEGLRV